MVPRRQLVGFPAGEIQHEVQGGHADRQDEGASEPDAHRFTMESAARLRNGYIREPYVAAEIEAYRPFFILGEVAAPGQYPFVPNMTIESAVAIAGGFSPRAKRDRVTVTHTDARGTVRLVVPTTTALSPGDTIVVGERWF